MLVTLFLWNPTHIWNNFRSRWWICQRLHVVVLHLNRQMIDYSGFMFDERTWPEKSAVEISRKHVSVVSKTCQRLSFCWSTTCMWRSGRSCSRLKTLFILLVLCLTSSLPLREVEGVRQKGGDWWLDMNRKWGNESVDVSVQLHSTPLFLPFFFFLLTLIYYRHVSILKC